MNAALQESCVETAEGTLRTEANFDHEGRLVGVTTYLVIPGCDAPVEGDRS